MNGRFHRSARVVSSFLRVAACIVGIAVLFTYPIPSAHQFTGHFRAPMVRRMLERDTSVAHSDASSTECIAQQAVFPALPLYVDEGISIKPVTTVEYASPVSISRLLSHLKLGYSR